MTAQRMSPSEIDGGTVRVTLSPVVGGTADGEFPIDGRRAVLAVLRP